MGPCSLIHSFSYAISHVYTFFKTRSSDLPLSGFPLFLNMPFFQQLSWIVLLSALVLQPYIETASIQKQPSSSPKPPSASRPVVPPAKPQSVKKVATPRPKKASYTRKKAASTPVVNPAACKPFTEHFTTAVGVGGSQWKSLSSRSDSLRMTPGGGIELVLNRPAGAVTLSKDGTTNDKLGDGATINSTFSFLYGKVTTTLQASGVPGTITAAVLIGTETSDEIDIEIAGGDPTHWQTNVFRTAPGETSPLYGVFGGMHGYLGNGRCDAFHTYVVDWSPARIQWSVDGQVVRTLTPSQTLHGGQQHYPSAPSRIQIGVWDASNPSGTSQWAKGPIPWSKVGKTPITSHIKSLVVECPYS